VESASWQFASIFMKAISGYKRNSFWNIYHIHLDLASHNFFAFPKQKKIFFFKVILQNVQSKDFQKITSGMAEMLECMYKSLRQEI
jgi:hypothetical protein